MSLGWGVLLDRSGRWGAVAYLTSLTPLLRFTSADQTWNRLDLVFPVVVWLGLMWTAWSKQTSEATRNVVGCSSSIGPFGSALMTWGLAVFVRF